MKIKIIHKTSYNYSSVVPRLVQSLKLHPTNFYNQKVVKWSIKCNKGKLIESHKDSLDHKIFNIFNQNLKGNQTIISEGVIKTKDNSGIMKGLSKNVHPKCFLRQTSLTKACDKIIRLSNKAKSLIKNEIDFCHKLNFIAGNSIKHVSGSTSIYTSAEKSILLGKGVCQDFAHILISMARHHNFPSRYINGFLLEDSNSRENTTHAWVEIFINNIGWIAFDPSHKKCVDEKYVRVSCGLDFLDASTIKGVKTNYSGNESLSVKVQIYNSQ